MSLYEIKLPKDSNGWCTGTDGLLCGVCECCMWLFRNDDTYDDIYEWRKNRCFIWAQKYYQRKISLEREAVLEAIDDIPFHAMKVGFPRGFDPKKALKIMLEATKTHGWNNGIWNIEYFSKEHPNGDNLHFHLLQPRCNTKYKQGALINHMSKATGIKDNFIEYVKSKTTFTHQVNYICGIKKEDKMKYVELDRKWREEMGFPHIFQNFPKVLKNKYKKQIEYATA